MKFLLFFLASASALANTTYRQVTLNCTALNEGYTTAQNVDLMYLEKTEDYSKKSIEYVAINHHQSFEDQGGYADPLLGTYHGISSRYNEDNEGWEFSYEIEYFTNTFTILGDDSGYKMLSHYISDGPVEYGFYTCKGSTETLEPIDMSAWSRLEKALDADVATEYEVKITGEAFCGEYDPYFLGDTCGYDVKILNDNVTAESKGKATIYFYDYDVDGLKIGDKVTVRGITIADYEDFDQPTLAVELQ